MTTRIVDEAPDVIEHGSRGREAELLGLLRRERADFVNYKRRVELERALDAERARAGTVEKLLPVLDELDRAFDHLPEALTGDAWVQGMALTRHELEQALRNLGLERLGAVAERFDPVIHEAVAYEPQQEGLDEPVVSAIERAGYRLGPHLIRAARVRVAGPRREGNPKT